MRLRTSAIRAMASGCSERQLDRLKSCLDQAVDARLQLRRAVARRSTGITRKLARRSAIVVALHGRAREWLAGSPSKQQAAHNPGIFGGAAAQGKRAGALGVENRC